MCKLSWLGKYYSKCKIKPETPISKAIFSSYKYSHTSKIFVYILAKAFSKFKHQARSGYKVFATLLVFWKECFEKISYLNKKSADDKNVQNYQGCKNVLLADVMIMSLHLC